MTTVCYLYAIVYTADTGSMWLPRGIDGEPSYAVVAGSLAGVVAELDRAPFQAAHGVSRLREDDWLARAVRAHDRVVRRVFSQAPLVPVRFGMMFATRAGVEEFLSRRVDHLRESLDHVALRVSGPLPAYHSVMDGPRP